MTVQCMNDIEVTWKRASGPDRESYSGIAVGTAEFDYGDDFTHNRLNMAEYTIRCVLGRTCTRPNADSCGK